MTTKVCLAEEEEKAGLRKMGKVEAGKIGTHGTVALIV